MNPTPNKYRMEICYLHGRLPYKEIASRLSITKNAVAGIIHRHGSKIDLLKKLEERLNFKKVMKGGCRWVYGDPGIGEWSWCGNRINNGSSYCDVHYRQTYKVKSGD